MQMFDIARVINHLYVMLYVMQVRLKCVYCNNIIYYLVVFLVIIKLNIT